MGKKDFFNQNKRFFIDDPLGIATYVKEHCPRELGDVLAVAEDVVRQSFLFTLRWDMERTHQPVVFPGEIDWLHQPADDPEWVYAFNRMRFWICLGQAYAVTGEERYAETFARQLVHWIDRVKRDDPRCAPAWRTIEAGLRLEYWLKAMCYFGDSPAITDAVMDKFIASVIQHAEYIMDTWDSYHLMSNWGVLENHGLYLAGVMLPSTPRTKEYLREAVRRLEREIEIQVYEDGVQWEQSPMYHNEVLHCYLDVVLLAQRNGITLPDVIPEKTREMCRVDVLWQKPNGHEIAMGDSDDIDLRDLVSKGAVIFRDGLLKSGGYEELDFDCVWDLGIGAVEEYRRLPSRRPESLGTALKDSGNYVFRSGWEEEAAFLHFHCGTLGAGHGHADQLHIDLFANGEDILVDAGRYTYVDKPERREFKSAAAHNTTTVDGQEAYLYQDSWACSRLSRPVNQKFRDTPAYGYAEGGHLGYCGLPQGVFANRKLLYIKPDILIVCDEFYTGGAHSYQQYFHFDSRGNVEHRPGGYRYQSPRNVVEICSGTEGTTWESIPSRMSRQYNQMEDNGALVCRREGEGFASLLTVLSWNHPDRVEALSVEKVPVFSNFKGIQFPDSHIEALCVEKGERYYTVVLAHQEYASPTDTFRADGCTGFGQVAVFDRGAGEDTTGIILLR